jgi:hypothetical protein
VRYPAFMRGKPEMFSTEGEGYGILEPGPCL